MTIEQAIKKAEESGYQSPRIKKIPDWNVFYVYLDPSFWQCLGKEMGWVTNNEVQWIIPSGMTHREAIIQVEDRLGVPIKELNDRIIYLPYANGKRTWKEEWHRFIDKLASGGSAEEFFENLTKP